MGSPGLETFAQVLISLPMCLCAASTCFLVILHLTIRMMTTTVHTSTSVDGITVLMMIMVDTGRPVWTSVDCCCVGRKVEVGVWVPVWTSVDCCRVGRKVEVGVWVTRAGYESGVDRESAASKWSSGY